MNEKKNIFICQNHIYMLHPLFVSYYAHQKHVIIEYEPRTGVAFTSIELNKI